MSTSFITSIQKHQYEKTFAKNRGANLFRGVFTSFEEAERSAPKTLPLGYDNPESAAMYLERTRKTYPTDYPVLFWLNKLFADGVNSVFDVGGHIGVSYYAYRRYLAYPPHLRWVVHDVPAVMARGREFAQERDKERCLDFADTFDRISGFDVMTAQGSLQYLPESLAERLASVAVPPKHLVINLTPLHERLSFYTLQSVGTAFCPYRILSVAEFLRPLEQLGYQLIDSWDNPDKKCHIPFYPEHSLERYHGFLFSRVKGREL